MRRFRRPRRVVAPSGLLELTIHAEAEAALKVIAIKDDPGRSFQEMADIRFLLTLSGVDRQEVRAYFERHGLEERFDEIAERL